MGGGLVTEDEEIEIRNMAGRPKRGPEAQGGPEAKAPKRTPVGASRQVVTGVMISPGVMAALRETRDIPFRDLIRETENHIAHLRERQRLKSGG